MLRIGPVSYRVEFIDDPRLNGVSTDGVIDPEANIIRVSAGLPAGKSAVILWHEILHAIEIDRGLSFTEREVDALSRAIVDMLIDNPEWLSRLAPVPNTELRYP